MLKHLKNKKTFLFSLFFFFFKLITDIYLLVFLCFRGNLLPDGAKEGFSGGAGLSSTGPCVSSLTLDSVILSVIE